MRILKYRTVDEIHGVEFMNGWIDPQGRMWPCPSASHRRLATALVKRNGYDDWDSSFFAKSLAPGDEAWHPEVDPGIELELRGWGKAYYKPGIRKVVFICPKGWTRAQERFILDVCFKLDIPIPLGL